MSIIKITDKNGKDFEVTLEQITDVDNGGAVVSDSEILKDFKLSLTDSDGKVLDSFSIKDDDNKDAPVIAADVTFESCHSGLNLNSGVYHSDSLEKDSETWLVPFSKPFIKNHDTDSEPLGRAKDVSFGMSEIVSDRDTINVTYRITDMDAIQKFCDGRYKTMSIGATAKTITCNVCGKHIVKDGKFKFCGHWRGESYGDKVATWNFRDMTFREGSIVNTPADMYAMAKSIVLVRKEAAPKDGEVVDPNQTVIDALDGLTGDVTDAQENPVIEVPEVADGNDTDPVVQDTVESLNEKFKEYYEKVLDLEHKLSKALISGSSQLETIKEKDEVISQKDAEIASGSEKLKQIAEFNKTVLIDSISKLRGLSVEDSEALSKKKVSELYQMLKDEKAATAENRVPGVVINPSLANVDGDTSTGTTSQGTEEKPKTLQDMYDVAYNIFNK